jgi:hypothetical protein
MIDVTSFGADPSGLTDSTAAIQAAVSSIEEDWLPDVWVSKNTRVLYMEGDFLISSTIAVKKSIIIQANCTLNAAPVFSGTAMMSLVNRVTFDGNMNFLGNGTVPTAIAATNIGRSVFHNLVFHRFPYYAFDCLGQGNNDVKLRANFVRCGSGSSRGMDEDPKNPPVAYTKVSDSAGGIKELSILDAVVPEGTQVVKDGANYHCVMWISTSQIAVFPKIASSSGTLIWYRGGGVHTRGNDSNAWDMEIDSIKSRGIIVCMQTLYGHNIRRFTSEACGIGILFGSPPNGPTINSVAIMPYFEGNDADMLLCARNSWITVIEPMDAQGDKYKSILNSSLFADSIYQGFTIIREGGFHVPVLNYLNKVNFSSGPPNSEFRAFFERTLGTLTNTTLPLHAPLKRGSGRIELYLRGYDQADFTITAPPGYTIEGNPVFLLQASSPANKKLELFLVDTDYKVAQIALL